MKTDNKDAEMQHIRFRYIAYIPPTKEESFFWLWMADQYKVRAIEHANTDHPVFLADIAA